MTNQGTKRVALNPPAAAAALARTDRQRPNALITPTPTAPQAEQQPAVETPPKRARATRQTTSTRIPIEVERNLRQLGEGKRWGRWVEAELKNTETHYGDRLETKIVEMIREEDEAIELRHRVSLSLRITTDYRQHLDHLAQNVQAQTAVVLRCLLELTHERIAEVPSVVADREV